MIVLSRIASKGGVIAFALLLASSLLVGSCSSRGCNAIGCSTGLTIELAGDRDGGVATLPLQIEFATLVDGTHFVPFMTCTLSSSGTETLGCNSERSHSERGSRTIYLPTTEIQTLRVTYSANGAQLGEETISPAYTSEEIWGEGCGFCTRATVRLTVPPP
jgi:hypothetical protein